MYNRFSNVFFATPFMVQATGPMLHYANGKPVAGEDACHPNVIHVHTQCIEWYVYLFHTEISKSCLCLWLLIYWSVGLVFKRDLYHLKMQGATSVLFWRNC